MNDPNTIWAWACIGVGAYLAGYALYSLKTGETQGYYRDHRHRGADVKSRFGLWVWFRLVLGIACFVMGIVFV